MEKLPQVDIYTDGACSGNPGPGGWAAIIRSGPHEKELTGGAKHTTNNRMELTAALEALKALSKPCAVNLHTDSKYLIGGLTEWMPGWLRRGWKNAQGKKVENQDIWEHLNEAVKPHNIKFIWVKGHAGHDENERVDQLAVKAIDKFR